MGSLQEQVVLLTTEPSFQLHPALLLAQFLKGYGGGDLLAQYHPPSMSGLHNVVGRRFQ